MQGAQVQFLIRELRSYMLLPYASTVLPKKSICVTLSHYIWVICYSSKRKLIQCSIDVLSQNAGIEKCLWAQLLDFVLFLSPLCPELQAKVQMMALGPQQDTFHTQRFTAHPHHCSQPPPPPLCSVGPAGAGLGGE